MHTSVDNPNYQMVWDQPSYHVPSPHKRGDEGMVADYNTSKSATGSWDLLLLPGMGVSAVNGVSDDPEKMLQVQSSELLGTPKNLHIIPGHVSQKLYADV